MRAMLGLTVFGVVGLAGCTCGEPPALRGAVVDPWGTPVAGAAVTMPGVAQAATSGDDGGFSLPLKQGKYEVAASRDGFVAGKREVAVADVDDDVKIEPLTLFPVPGSEGVPRRRAGRLPAARAGRGPAKGDGHRRVSWRGVGGRDRGPRRELPGRVSDGAAGR